MINFVFVSAIGKTTNFLEEVWRYYYWLSETNQANAKEAVRHLDAIKDFHLEICRNLFPKEHDIFKKVENKFNVVSKTLQANNMRLVQYEPRDYSWIVSKGEVVSSMIVSDYLKLKGYDNFLLNAKEIVKTHGTIYRNAEIDLVTTKCCLLNNLRSLNPPNGQLNVVMAGFIASRAQTCQTVTLGREGSDISASVIARLLSEIAGEAGMSPTIKLKFFKEHAYHETDPAVDSKAFHMKEVSFDQLQSDIARPEKKAIVHKETLKIIENNCAVEVEFIKFHDLTERTSVTRN